MEIFESHIEPSFSRAPFSEGGGTDYCLKCPNCENSLKIEFNELLNGAWNLREKFTEEEIGKIIAYFRIGIVSKSHDGGWPSFNIVNCKKCSSQYISYIGLNEYCNSAYRITEQGLASVKTYKS